MTLANFKYVYKYLYDLILKLKLFAFTYNNHTFTIFKHKTKLIYTVHYWTDNVNVKEIHTHTNTSI